MIGLFVLLSLFYFSSPVEISRLDELENLSDNQKVLLKGPVEDERFIQGGSVFYISDIRVYCKGCKESYLDREVFVEGVVENYRGLEVVALTIKKAG